MISSQTFRLWFVLLNGISKTKQNKSIWELGTKLNPIKTQHIREIRPRENHRTRLSYIYISVEDSREFPSPCR
ncbi:unnamed protein product [Brassica oleracea]